MAFQFDDEFMDGIQIKVVGVGGGGCNAVSLEERRKKA